MYEQLSIHANHLGEALAGALNDVGFGDSEDADWFVDEFFHRIKGQFHGSSVSLEEAVQTTKELLDKNKEEEAHGEPHVPEEVEK